MEILEILGKIGFDWQVAFANLVGFLIIFWILKKYAFHPLEKTIEERQKKIASGLENAKEAEEKLRLATDEKEDIVKEARAEARRIVEEARTERQNILDKVKNEAEEEALLIKDKALKEIGREEEKMSKRLREEAREVVIAGVEKILGEKMDEKEAKQFQETLIRS